MRVEKRNLYTFEELADKAREKAISDYRDSGPLHGYEWWDGVFMAADDVFEALGVDATEKWFSGFWSQGDGACFEGTYSYSAGWRDKLKKTILDDDLVDIGERLQAAQRPHFYELRASVTHHGRHCHELSMNIQVEDHNDPFADLGDREEEVKQALRDLACWLYRSLESEYEWLMSDEQISESLISNEYEFLESGEIL